MNEKKRFRVLDEKFRLMKGRAHASIDHIDALRREAVEIARRLLHERRPEGFDEIEFPVGSVPAVDVKWSDGNVAASLLYLLFLILGVAGFSFLFDLYGVPVAVTEAIETAEKLPYVGDWVARFMSGEDPVHIKEALFSMIPVFLLWGVVEMVDSLFFSKSRDVELSRVNARKEKAVASLEEFVEEAETVENEMIDLLQILHGLDRIEVELETGVAPAYERLFRKTPQRKEELLDAFEPVLNLGRAPLVENGQVGEKFKRSVVNVKRAVLSLLK